jgi:hypothetical protein
MLDGGGGGGGGLAVRLWRAFWRCLAAFETTVLVDGTASAAAAAAAAAASAAAGTDARWDTRLGSSGGDGWLMGRNTISLMEHYGYGLFQSLNP